MSSAYRVSFAVAAALALALAVPVSAQQRAPSDAGLAPLTSAMRVTAPAFPLAPMSESAALAVRATDVAGAASMVPLPVMRRSQSVALMIVGGAGMIVGSLIDGDTGTIIMVGGGIMGLVGLFQYLR